MLLAQDVTVAAAPRQSDTVLIVVAKYEAAQTTLVKAHLAFLLATVTAASSGSKSEEQCGC
jgi:hypothetical protein